MIERIRELERAAAADPQDLETLRELADERRRRGLELLPSPRRQAAIFIRCGEFFAKTDHFSHRVVHDQSGRSIGEVVFAAHMRRSSFRPGSLGLSTGVMLYTEGGDVLLLSTDALWMRLDVIAVGEDLLDARGRVQYAANGRP